MAAILTLSFEEFLTYRQIDDAVGAVAAHGPSGESWRPRAARLTLRLGEPFLLRYLQTDTARIQTLSASFLAAWPLLASSEFQVSASFAQWIRRRSHRIPSVAIDTTDPTMRIE